MQEYFNKLMGFMERFQGMSVDSMIHLLVLGGLAAFGILNVILGYRLLRFWMMLGGFAIGAGLGYLIVDMLELSDRNTILGICLGTGVALGLIAFLIYKAGIFMLGAGIGLTVSVYVFHPTTSASFFVCILAGIGLGVLGVKFARPVVIFATSVMGGLLAGFSISKLVNIAQVPYGLLIGLGLAALGILIQFATNKPELIEEEDEEEEAGEERTKIRKKAEDPEEMAKQSDKNPHPGQTDQNTYGFSDGKEVYRNVQGSKDKRDADA